MYQHALRGVGVPSHASRDSLVDSYARKGVPPISSSLVVRFVAVVLHFVAMDVRLVAMAVRFVAVDLVRAAIYAWSSKPT